MVPFEGKIFEQFPTSQVHVSTMANVTTHYAIILMQFLVKLKVLIGRELRRALGALKNLKITLESGSSCSMMSCSKPGI